MKIEPLQLGQNQANINALVKTKLTKYSPKETVMTEYALELIRKNQELAPGRFEQFRAKAVAIIIGGALPIAISALFVAEIYGLYQTGSLAILAHKIEATITGVAIKVFAGITASKTATAATTGGAVLATVVLTQKDTKEVIGSFFGSLFGTLTGSGIARFVKETQTAGYNWWYDKYQFPQRLKSIESNKDTIVTFLEDTYNDLSGYLKDNYDKCRQDANALRKFHDIVGNLKEKLPTIHEIFQKQGISYNKCIEITLQFEKAIRIIHEETAKYKKS